MFIALLLFWLLLNGKITLELVIIGLIISALVYIFACFFLHFSIKKDFVICKNIHLIIAYIFVLIVEVIKSNINMIKSIYSFKHVEPVVAKFDVEIKSSFLRVLFANSITLTPGTITINMTDDEFVVHALKEEYIDDIKDSTLLKILKKLEARLSW